MDPVGYVFGYGSLAAEGLAGLDRVRRPRGFVADLRDFARGWGVAMDNRRDLPGYKRYRDAAGGRPDVFVAFLDVAPAPRASVTGVCLPVDAAGLTALDARERNYARVEVDVGLSPGPVWTYVGTAAGRARLAAGRAAGTAVVDSGYLATVRDGLRALGPAEWARCAPSLDTGELPVVELVREPVPGPAPAAVSPRAR